VFPRKAGAKDLLVALAARGVPMGVASSTRRKEVLRRLLAVGFDGHFHSVIGGDEF
jgi:beta-phosphoglucomutase-like phosphatase (HAD superfamily)